MVKFLKIFTILSILASADIYMQCCPDESACNFEINCTDNNNLLCEYPDECMVCFGENTICESESVNFLDNWNGCHDESELATWLEYNWGYNLRPYNDIWGYTDSSGSQYALVGTWDGTHIINIDNSPVEVGFIPGSFSTHRDIKTYGHYMYMGTEANLGDPSLLPEWFVDSEGVQVVDISDPGNPLLVNEWQEGIIQSHNIMVDETGYLYVIGADEGDDTDDLHILDLSNPSNPVKVGGWSLDSSTQSGYLHDVCVYEDILYGCGIYDHKMFAIDVSDKTNPQLIAEWPGVPSAHACWVSDDGNTVFTGSETTGGYIMSWDVSDLNNINLIDEWMPDNGQNWSAHNVFVKGNYLYISYYVYGLQILDISDPSNIFSVGFYDTYPEEEGGYVYSGVWGTFPYLDDNKVIMTDRVNGLYVLEHIIDQVYDLGDINQDGEVNVLDVIVMINMIIGSEEQDEIADINDDGDVNVLDIVELVSIVLNGSSNLSDECYLEPDSGPCLAYVPMYYYNTDTQACEMFIWGGCGGTVPFENIEDCINSCE